MGFNNEGVDALVKNLERTRWKGVIGVNIGKNKDTPNDHALRDSPALLERVWDVAGYIVVNISSPNTAGLRELQHGDPLRALLAGLREAQERWPRSGARRPVLVKIAPTWTRPRCMRWLRRWVRPVWMASLPPTPRSIAAKWRACATPGSRRVVRGTAVGWRPRRCAGCVRILIPVSRSSAWAASERCRCGRQTRGRRSGAVLRWLVYRGPALVRECVEAIRRRREQGVRR